MTTHQNRGGEPRPQSTSLQDETMQLPRPEHPRPNWHRELWLNLNGAWQFAFDPRLEGEHRRWYRPENDHPFEQQIVVPFPWESKLSGVARKDYLGAGWYRREITMPRAWQGQRVWLHFGAVDWHARVWLNGRPIGEHEGGYTPFAFDMTPYLQPDVPAQLVVRAFDVCDATTPLGKQVPRWYNHSSGIWQTVWLEATGAGRIVRAYITPDLAGGGARVRLTLQVPAAGQYRVVLKSPDAAFAPVEQLVGLGNGEQELALEIPLDAPRLWHPEGPHLYHMAIGLFGQDGAPLDRVTTYFGMRSISTGRWNGRSYEYVLLNGEPVYLRGALDQAFHPDGLHTYPSDDAIRADIQLARDAGLNTLRCHIKVNDPRYYYWADRLGVLVLSDLPSPAIDTAAMRQNWEATFRAALDRDFNHPSIITWVLFNETWGLDQHQTKDSQDWLARMVRLAKTLDPTRPVEDNSPIRYDHTATDLNSWHYYIDDYPTVRAHVERVVNETFPGSTFNFVGGEYRQGTQPLLNSEFGGISAAHGDLDTSWALKYQTMELRRHDQICGYVFTEMTDVEWEHNGLVNYDRTPKAWGYDTFVPGMSLRDIFGPDVVGADCPPCQTRAPGATLEVPLFVSNFGRRALGEATIRWQLDFVDRFGARRTASTGDVPVRARHYGVTEAGRLMVALPDESGLATLALWLLDGGGVIVNRNYVNVEVYADSPAVERIGGAIAVRFRPADCIHSTWPRAPIGPHALKFAGIGAGAVSYRVALPADLNPGAIRGLRLLFEASARAGLAKVDWPERARNTDYPQTEPGKTFPTDLTIRLDGRAVATITLPDDPADARGVLSHHANLDPGSYGYLQELRVPPDVVAAVREAVARDRAVTAEFVIPPEAPNRGGLALYGARVGAYPVDPTLFVEIEA